MKFLISLLFFICATYCSDVIDLTDSNFSDGIKDKDIILVEFYAPWCGHCKRLAPEYDTASIALSKNDPPIPLAKVDCVGEGKDTCSKYGVSGYPTLKIFRGGQFSQEYDGPRDSSGIISYMKKNSGPASVLLKDAEHLDKKIENAEDILIVGFFGDNSDLQARFLKAADQKRNDFNFAHSADAAINAKAGHTDAIVMYRPKHLHAKFEDPKLVLSNPSASTYDITQFIKDNQAGLVGQIKPDSELAFKKPLVVAYFKVDWKRNPKGTRYWRNRVARVAKKFVGDITFAIGGKEDYTRKLSDWGFSADDDEVYVIGHNEKGQVFKMSDKFSVDNLEKFTNEFKAGNIKPYIKSEPVPTPNDEPVKVVVGENFDEIVNDPTKDVLIEFYAPWCGHCKSLEPKYKELAETLKDVKDVVIAKMDATANDSPPQYQVSGFPTIYWSPIGNKDSPKKYEGGREVKDFIEFIKKEATNPFELSEKKNKKKKKKKEL